MPWLLIEVRVAPGSAGFGLVINLSIFISFGRESLAQPNPITFLAFHLKKEFLVFFLFYSIRDLLTNNNNEAEVDFAQNSIYLEGFLFSFSFFVGLDFSLVICFRGLYRFYWSALISHICRLNYCLFNNKILFSTIKEILSSKFVQNTSFNFIKILFKLNDM